MSNASSPPGLDDTSWHRALRFALPLRRPFRRVAFGHYHKRGALLLSIFGQFCHKSRASEGIHGSLRPFLYAAHFKEAQTEQTIVLPEDIQSLRFICYGLLKMCKRTGVF